LFHVGFNAGKQAAQSGRIVHSSKLSISDTGGTDAQEEANAGTPQLCPAFLYPGVTLLNAKILNLLSFLPDNSSRGKAVGLCLNDNPLEDIEMSS